MIVGFKSAVFDLEIKVNVCFDRCQDLAELCTFFSFTDFLSKCAFDLITMCNDFFHASVFTQKLECCFFTYSGNTGDIIRMIAHQTFHIDDLLWYDAHLFLQGSLIHDLHLGKTLFHQHDYGI